LELSLYTYKIKSYEIGFMFENQFISTGLQHNSFHMNSTSNNLKNTNYYESGTFMGVSGNAGYSKGAHIHSEIIAKRNFTNNAYYSNNLQRRFLQKIQAPVITSYTNNYTNWQSNQNFYSDKYSTLYINTNNLWR